MDPEIPNTIRFIKNMLRMPREVARRAAYGIVRCCESIFSAIFTFSRKYVQSTGESLLEIGPRMTVKLLIGGMLAVGVSKMFLHFPHLKTWLEGGLSALRSLGILG